MKEGKISGSERTQIYQVKKISFVSWGISKIFEINGFYICVHVSFITNVIFYNFVVNNENGDFNFELLHIFTLLVCNSELICFSFLSLGKVLTLYTILPFTFYYFFIFIK